MRRMTWLDEILPWRDWQGWCMALALVFFWGLAEGAIRRMEQVQWENRQTRNTLPAKRYPKAP